MSQTSAQLVSGTSAQIAVFNAVTTSKLSFTSLGNYANDAAAAADGVAVGAVYRNGSVIQIRVS
jgi:hypothetical protein